MSRKSRSPGKRKLLLIVALIFDRPIYVYNYNLRYASYNFNYWCNKDPIRLHRDTFHTYSVIGPRKPRTSRYRRRDYSSEPSGIDDSEMEEEIESHINYFR